jgi:hypothetical protein
MVMQAVRGVPGLKAGLGIKAEYTEIDGQRYAAVPLGLKRSCNCLINTPFPFYVNGAFYYAPSSLCLKEGTVIWKLGSVWILNRLKMHASVSDTAVLIPMKHASDL